MKKHSNSELCSKALCNLKDLRGKIVSVKIGGEIADSKENTRSVFEDLIFLREEGVKVVICHGGGPQITRELKKRGVEAVFIEGQRVTDAATLETTCQVLLGEINRSLVAIANTISDCATGVSGIDARLFNVRAKDQKLGYVGQIESINTSYINTLIDAGYIPVIAPIGIGSEGQAYNINADSAAGALAGALKAEHHLVFTNVEGLYRSFPDKSSLIKHLNLAELSTLFNSGTLSEGMIPKIESIKIALQSGVTAARIVDGRNPNAILNSFVNSDSGTSITR